MRPPLPAVGLAALLFIAFGCHDELTPPDLREPAQPGPVGFALMEVTITGIGTGNMSASSAPLDSGGALAPSYSLSGPENADASGDGTIELDAVATGSFTDGTRAGGGQRYLYATFRVRNADSDGVAYDSQRENLTFLGVDTDGTHGVTAVSRLFTFGGAEITGADALAIAEAVIPTGQAGQSTGAELMSSGPDVLQVFTEAEVNVGSVPRPAGVNDIFPYGFITRNPDDLTSRTLPASPAADEFDGLVTFAFRLPLQASAAEDPFEISVMVLPMDDSETRITQSVEEQTASARSAMAERADALNAAYATVLPGSAYGGPRRLVCEPVRVAGAAGAASAALFAEPPEFVSLAPDPYAGDGSGSFVAATTSFAATFDAAAGEPTDSTFVVNGSQSGRRFLGGAYTGGGTATVTSPTGTFFPGEEVEVSLTTGLGGCPPHVMRLRVAAGAASGTFGAAVNYATGTRPHWVAIGDLDGDSDLDLAVANGTSDDVSVLLGNGDGTFAAAANYAAGQSPRSVAIGDLDGDGVLDLAVANFTSDDVSVLLGDGGGIFAAAENYRLENSPRSVVIGDLDGNGVPDLAVANFNSANVSVLLGSGDGTFAAEVNYGVGPGPYSVAVGDLDGDGDVDLAVANFGSDNLSVLLGNGDGTFAAAANHAAGDGPRSVAVGDLDGDGVPDLAVANNNSDNVSVLLGDGNGTFGAGVDYTTGNGPVQVAIGDLDGDGDLDLAVAKESSANVSVLMGNGDGTFPAVVNYAAGSVLRGVAIGDLNEDGRLDLAVSIQLTDDVSVLLGQP